MTEHTPNADPNAVRITPAPDTVVPVVWLPRDVPDGAELGPIGEHAGMVPCMIPADLVTAILFVETDPGELAPDDRAGRWQAITQHLLFAGVQHVYGRMAETRQVAHSDPDAFLWWESCRDQARRLDPSTRPGPDS